MGLALLSIGTSTDRIDLLGREGFHLAGWEPASTDDATTFAESALSDGRQPVASRDLNVVETFDLKLRASDHDDAAVHVQDLRRMLRAARNYWVSGDLSLSPVYLLARASRETNTRYAIVYNGRLPHDDNYYGQPFLQFGQNTIMDNLALIVERGPWLENPPGTGTCVQVSGEQGWETSQATDTAAPAAGTDDGWAFGDGGSWSTTKTVFPLGYYISGEIVGGIRFVGVNVPQGATIIAAYVTFEAEEADANNDTLVSIRAEQTDSAATFSTWNDFANRCWAPTARPVTVYWGPIEKWAAGNTYETPSLTTIIQQLVDRPGWAANNEIVLFFLDNKSTVGAQRRACSWDHATGAAPELTVVYATPQDFGRDETCDDEVYIANKHNQAQLTHVYHYDATGLAWSGNLVGAATPFEILPNPIQDGDVVYFGIETALADSGPFSNLVFDISLAATYSGTATLTWQYYNGAWVALTVQDNTGPPTNPFDYEGVNSVHWEQPSDWLAVPAAPAVGVMGYWVRCIATITAPPGDAITTPQQDNRDIYTIDWPGVEIAEDQVGGDTTALAQVRLQNWSGKTGGGSPPLYTARTILALRSVERGEMFTPFLNLAEHQNPPGVIVDDAYAMSSFATTTRSPTGQAVFFNSTGAGDSLLMLTRASVVLLDTIGPEFSGRYRVFVRGWQVTGGTLGNVTVRVRALIGGLYVYSPTRAFTHGADEFEALDMGIFTVPSGLHLTPWTASGYIEFGIQAQSVDAADDAYFTDLILMPIDEWSGEFLWPKGGLSFGFNGYSTTYGHSYLDVDSITYPKTNLQATLRQDESDAVQATWEPRCPGPAILLNGRQQRLYALNFLRIWHAASSSTQTLCCPEIAHSVQLFRNQRYDTLRGAR
jgi:hypothetical protein